VGYGGYDIFSVEKNNNRWSIARNLGVGVNSPRDDYAFIFDGIRNIGYFTSNRTKGKGSEDIYQVGKQTDEIMIRVLNASDRKPVAGATVDFGDCRKGTFKTDVNGVLYFKMEDELNCRVIIGMSGFSSSSLELSGLSTRNSKSFDIELKKDGEQYIGVVVDVDSKSPLNEVRVQAIAQETGQMIEDITNEKGEYVLALSDNRVYQIRYSRVGYTDINRTFPTGNGSNNKSLGAMPIKKVTSTTTVNLPDMETELSSNVPVEVPPIEALPARSYAIQVASAPQLNLNRFASLNVYGNVYYVDFDNTYKIRVGAFANKATAEQVLAEIRKAGHAEAFLVEELTKDVYDKILTDGLASLPNDIDEEESEYEDRDEKYKVQLGAYKDARNFDSNKVRNLGAIEKKEKKEFTLFLLTGYKTIEEARKAMVAAQKVGFPNAFVVADEQGELKRIKL
jgi:cell division septation protein DedD